MTENKSIFFLVCLRIRGGTPRVPKRIPIKAIMTLVRTSSSPFRRKTKNEKVLRSKSLNNPARIITEYAKKKKTVLTYIIKASCDKLNQTRKQ